jgi:proteasome accessory factor C
MSDQLTRILVMIPYIQRHPGIAVQELARYLDTTPETILADLDAVLLCGAPPYLPNDYIGVVLEGDRIYLSFAEHFKRPVNLTFEEALSLNLALRTLPLTRRGLEAAGRLQRKMVALLPAGARSLWRTARRQVEAGPRHPEVQARVALLEQAIEERREVHLEYYTASRDEMTERDVRPYGLIEHGGEWYLVGHCLLRDRELPFRVDRIRRASLLERAFEAPASFDIEKYRRPQMYFPTSRDLRVKLRIAPELARWVREEHPAGKIRALPDGSVILHLSVSQPQWIIAWVMAHAGKVELLAPEALRRQVAEACRKAAEVYGKGRVSNGEK